ncbi:hypothetical protein D3C73_1019040 [compost metagenome]
MLTNAIAPRTHHAQRVRFIDHQEGTVPLFDFNEVRQIREVAVHAVDTFQHDQDALELAA